MPHPADALGDVVPDVGRRGAPVAVRRQRDAGDQHRAARRRAPPRRRTAAPARPRTGTRPSGGPTSWLTVTKPAWIRRVRQRQVVALRRASAPACSTRCRRTSPRCPAGTSPPGRARSWRRRRPPRPRAAAGPAVRTRVDGDDEPPPVQPVGDRPGPQPEQQRRQPLEQRRQRDEERVVRPRRHQQRTGREHDAVAEVRASTTRPAATGTRCPAAAGRRCRRSGSRGRDGTASDGAGHTRSVCRVAVPGDERLARLARCVDGTRSAAGSSAAGSASWPSAAPGRRAAPGRGRGGRSCPAT